MKTPTAAKTSSKKTAKPAPAKDWINGECPACGKMGPHEWNGVSERSVGYSICCTGCGHQESPNEG